ncbi:hypothetical protein H8356DRAFT_1355036 [Neocallimastix lanati (nom. inval.)]|nr:hypothetical protein H8356DRAFT_1355036 [Neocallimastix sp. JGI-2020a]
MVVMENYKHRLHILDTHLSIWPYSYYLTLRRSQSSLYTARRCIPNVPTYISNDHEHQNGIINSSLVGVIIGDWKYYNHQVTCIILTDWTNMAWRIINYQNMYKMDLNNNIDDNDKDSNKNNNNDK